MSNPALMGVLYSFAWCRQQAAKSMQNQMMKTCDINPHVRLNVMRTVTWQEAKTNSSNTFESKKVFVLKTQGKQTAQRSEFFSCSVDFSPLDFGPCSLFTDMYHAHRVFVQLQSLSFTFTHAKYVDRCHYIPL